MSDLKKGRGRRWLQFSLRSLLVLVTAIVGLLVLYRVLLQPYDAQRETMALIEDLGGSYRAKPGGPAWLRALVGEKRLLDVTSVDLADSDETERYLDPITHLPQLKTLVVGGPKFSDRELRRLKQLTTLEVLILDSSNVTESGLAELRKALPELVVHKSPRRAIAAAQKIKVWLKTSPKPPERPALRRFHREAAAGDHFQAVIMAGFPTDHTWRFSNDDIALVKHFTDLEYLAVSKNGFKATSATSTFLESIRGIKNLKRLMLSGAKITDADLPQLLKSCANPHAFHVGSAAITDAGLVHLTKLKSLESLGLSGNRGITDAGVARLTDLVNLRLLSLSFTSIGDAGVEHLIKLPKLEWLQLAGIKVTDAGVARLSRMKTLKVLYVHETKITDAGLKHVGSMQNLEQLTLTGNGDRITDQGLDHLKPLTKLREIDLWLTGVSARGVAQLQQTHPGIRIRIEPEKLLPVKSDPSPRRGADKE